jgi:hypothetical protein
MVDSGVACIHQEEECAVHSLEGIAVEMDSTNFNRSQQISIVDKTS